MTKTEHDTTQSSIHLPLTLLLLALFSSSCLVVSPPPPAYPPAGPPNPAYSGARGSDGQAVGVLRNVASLTLHGSTPSLSWSPDSKKIVTNSAFEYYGYDEIIAEQSNRLGIYVIDTFNGSSARVYADQGYHPLWYNETTIAWGHSPYEKGEPGIFFMDLARERSARRLGEVEGVYHTRLATNGSLLFYSGWPEEQGWSYFNPNDGLFWKAEYPEDGSVSSWSAPRDLVVEQCLQQVGDVEVSWRGQEADLRVGGQAIPLGPVYVYQQDAVKPCLSPDGAYIAYFTKAPEIVGYTLNVAQISR